jgi:hypothetical protein
VRAGTNFVPAFFNSASFILMALPSRLEPGPWFIDTELGGVQVAEAFEPSDGSWEVALNERNAGRPPARVRVLISMSTGASRLPEHPAPDATIFSQRLGATKATPGTPRALPRSNKAFAKLRTANGDQDRHRPRCPDRPVRSPLSPTAESALFEFVHDGIDPRNRQPRSVLSVADRFIDGNGDRFTKQFGAQGLICHLRSPPHLTPFFI